MGDGFSSAAIFGSYIYPYLENVCVERNCIKQSVTKLHYSKIHFQINCKIAKMAGAMMLARAAAPDLSEKVDNLSYLTNMAESPALQEIDEEVLKERESGIMELGKQYKDEGKAKELGKLIKLIRPFTKLISKAKAAKLVRELVDIYLDMDAATGYEVDLCKECIEWAKEEKRTFLRQSLEAR